MPKERTMAKLLQMHDDLQERLDILLIEHKKVLRQIFPEVTRENVHRVYTRSLFVPVPYSKRENICVIKFRYSGIIGTEYDYWTTTIYDSVDSDTFLLAFPKKKWSSDMEELANVEYWKTQTGYDESLVPALKKHLYLDGYIKNIRERIAVVVERIRDIVLRHTGRHPQRNRYRIYIGNRVISMERGDIEMKDTSEIVIIPEDETILEGFKKCSLRIRVKQVRNLAASDKIMELIRCRKQER